MFPYSCFSLPFFSLVIKKDKAIFRWSNRGQRFCLCTIVFFTNLKRTLVKNNGHVCFPPDRTGQRLRTANSPTTVSGTVLLEMSRISLEFNRPNKSGLEPKSGQLVQLGLDSSLRSVLLQYSWLERFSSHLFEALTQLCLHTHTTNSRLD